MREFGRRSSVGEQRTGVVIDLSLPAASADARPLLSPFPAAMKKDLGWRPSRIAELSKNAKGDWTPLCLYDQYGEQRNNDWLLKRAAEKAIAAHDAVLVGSKAGVAYCSTPSCVICAGRRQELQDKGVISKVIGGCGPALLTNLTFAAAFEMLLPTSSPMVKQAISTFVSPPRNLPDAVLAAGGWLGIMPGKTK